MAASNDLHRLIHSLTPSEKRYFRLNVQPYIRKTGNLYLQIFDAVLEQETYDQKALIEKLSRDRPIKRFSAEKNYLYQLLLKVMRNYTAERDVFRKIRGMILDVEFLFDKALYPESMKALEKASKLAREYDDLPSQVELLAWERKLLKRNPDQNKLQKLEELVSRKDQLMDQLATETHYADLYDHFFLVSQQDSLLRREEDLERIQSLLTDTELDQEEKAVSFKSKHLYFQVRSMLHLLKGEHEEARQYYGQLITHWENAPHQIAEDPGKYKTLLFNYLAYCQISDRFQEYPEMIKRIKGYPARSQREAMQDQYNLFNCELLYYLNSEDLEGGIDVIQRLEAWLVLHEPEVPKSKLLGFYYNSSLLLFLSGQFRMALKWVNRVLNFPFTQARRDSVQFARILHLIIHFELENFELIENLLRSARRYFQKSDRFFQFEDLFLRIMRKLIRQPSVEWESSFLEMRKGLNQLKARGSEWPGLKETEFWLESKLTRLPIFEIVEQDRGAQVKVPDKKP